MKPAGAAPVPEGKAKTSRAVWERILVWGLILGLLGLVGFEWNARRSYEATLTGLESAIGAIKEDAGPAGIADSEVDQYVKGSPTRTEDAGAAGIGAGSRRLVFRWPSLFKTYKIGVTINDKGRAVLAENVVDDEKPDASDKRRDEVPAAIAKKLLRRPTFESAGADRETVSLSPGERKFDMHHVGCGSLAFELVRQSFLIAARDELGLSTRDASLGELSLSTESSKVFPLELSLQPVLLPDSGPEKLGMKVSLSGAGPSGKPLDWSSSVITVTGSMGLVPLLEQAEALSRGEFITALKEAGYEKSAQPPLQPAQAADGSEGQMDFVSQFAVVRQLHAERRATGETAENLGALVRAYANLGNLIEFHWSPASKALKARALLYAQRLKANFENAKAGHAHRAYALALTGSHALALQDATAARSGEGSAEAGWLSIIEAYCEYSPETLAAATGKNRELALYLQMRMCDPDYDRKNFIAAIREFSQVNEACPVIPECMCDARELLLVRAATEGVSDQIWLRIHERMAAIPDLPAKAQEIARGQKRGADPDSEHRARVELMAQLRGAGTDSSSRIEPSWIVLSEMIGDATLVQCLRVVDSTKSWLGLPADEQIVALAPLVKGHRYEKCLECYSDDRSKAVAAVQALAATADQASAEIPSAAFATFTYYINQAWFDAVHPQHRRNWDPIFDDLVRMRHTNSPDLQEPSAALFGAVSPNQPQSIVLSIEKNWEEVSQHSEEWEQKYATNAAALGALGVRYRRLGRSDDAVRCLKKSVDVDPTHDIYSALADEYHDRGEKDLCRETFEQATELPSYGLEQSIAHTALARLLMQDREWEKAKPHAMAAASTYSGGGLLVAAELAEGMQEWAVAERYMRALSERYETSADDWYFWCVRVGRGDVEAARQLAESVVWSKTATPGFTYNQLWSRGMGEIIAGDSKSALATFTADAGTFQDVFSFLIASLLAEKLGDTATRDECYKQIEVRYDRNFPVPNLVRLFRTAMKDPNKFHWNRLMFDELVEVASRENVVFIYYCAGTFLEVHGEHDLAREYLECAATTSSESERGCILACHDLRSRKISFGPMRTHNRPDSWFPAFEHLAQAWRAEREKKYDRAMERLNEAIRLNPQFTTAYITRGRVNEIEGNLGAAIKDYEAVLSYYPDCEKAHIELSLLKSSSEKEEFRDAPGALAHAQAAFELRFAKAATNYSALAAAHAELGQFDKAVENLTEALKLAPKDEEFRKMMTLYQEKKPYRYSLQPAAKQ